MRAPLDRQKPARKADLRGDLERAVGLESPAKIGFAAGILVDHDREVARSAAQLAAHAASSSSSSSPSPASSASISSQSAHSSKPPPERPQPTSTPTGGAPSWTSCWASMWPRGVEELDGEKLPPLLKLRYAALQDAFTDLCKPDQVQGMFVGFQRHLYGVGQRAEA